MATPKKLVCLITGANQGIGYEVAKSLATTTRGPNGETYHVLLGSRDLAKGEKAAEEILASCPNPTGSVSVLQIDVTSATSIQEAVAQFQKNAGQEEGEEPRLDILINNAGIISGAPELVTALSADLETNVLGAARVTEAFLPFLLLKGKKNQDDDGDDARLIFLSSSMGSLAGASDPTNRYYRSAFGTSPIEYRVSKAALNMLMLEYWKRYGAELRCPPPNGPKEGEGEGEGEGTGRRIRTWSADPGPNATNFMGHGLLEKAKKMGIQGPEAGAKIVVGCVTGERDGDEGKVVGVYGIGPW